MGEMIRFRWKRPRGKMRPPGMLGAVIVSGIILGTGASAIAKRPAAADPTPVKAVFACDNPRVVDGDTLRCGATRVRLSGIDAPELPGHCRQGRTCVSGDPYASIGNLRRLIGGRPLTCRQTDTDRYGRVVALCSVGGRNLSCEQVRGGYAVRRYAPLSC
ncbi:thermonuclease family protein [Sphingomonas sp. CL5.1]|uniref:thermonuclease family protein n=1 Tax=Sphingomonas sp. CL5.1 TaxID=2653203 RepID=UPI0020C5CCED|nr:thermonuclease family protein [Sphingomonas sp. CL5.1]